MIAEAEESVGRKLPATYGQFLAVHDGGEGFVGENYLILWSIVELASANRDYQVEEWVPGLLLFGSNGASGPRSSAASQL